MIQLLLTEGNALTRHALRLSLEATAGLAVVAEAGTGAELLAQLASTLPTIVLLDLCLPEPDAFALLPVLCAQNPQLRVLAHGKLTNEHYVVRALDLGAHGYLLKSARPTERGHALRTVAAGRPFLCSSIGLALLRQLYTPFPPAANDADRAALGLSKRELEVLGLVADGLTNAEIAGKLLTSKRTVETHRQNIMDKTQARNTAALIKLAVRQGLIS